MDGRVADGPGDTFDDLVFAGRVAGTPGEGLGDEPKLADVLCVRSRFD